MRITTAVCITILFAMSTPEQFNRPKQGFVPDSTTAVKIAEAVLVPIYGEKMVDFEKPFRAELKGGVWDVFGTLYCPDGKGGRQTVGCIGGVAEVWISKTDATIQYVIHGK